MAFGIFHFWNLSEVGFLNIEDVVDPRNGIQFFVDLCGALIWDGSFLCS